ncbi:hypothetical protein TMS3_0108720 [Pseudomonas taeanensis MS-3]|uniref:Uncharacterized protein n=1 Tax=Pseudomonas taeanensis MS-3 TaxID=1395571 RepID=A0A0A1YI77_9PSED|nr:hypothetical protein [Pseudomonas taeanensis]KFX69595.1 hypothetical protein TMS3_0108720 [Pseudomonas taeanensis MS-3]
MSTLIFGLGFVVFCAGIHSCLQGSADELEQAALLPFADDPQAARNMTAATGRVCEHLVTVTPQREHDPEGYRLRA